MKKDKRKRKQDYPDCYFESVIGKEGCSGYTANLLAGGDCCERCKYFMGDSTKPVANYKADDGQ